MKTWVVVADAHRARLFEAEHNLSRLAEIEDLWHSAAVPAGDAGAAPHGRHGIAVDTLAAEREARVFARELAQRLHRDFLQHYFDDLTLVAPAHFLGLLRRALDAKVDLVVSRAIARELTRASLAELEDCFSRL